jgi:2-methylisocitrate lyase-like PEP mutase family enzyme
MRSRPSLRKLASEECPLVAVAAHDALSARLIARAGFKAIAIGGSSMLAARYGMPDIGLAALEEMASGARDILAATDLPVIIDGDDGYGDVKSVAHTMQVYEHIGVSGVVLEDQSRETKQPGDDKPQGVVPAATMTGKLRAAAASRSNPDLLIIARTDSYHLEGLDGALRRGERYLAAGADGIFIPGIRTVEELARVGKTFAGSYQFVAMFETGKTPFLPPAELHEMGYSQVVYPAAIMLRTVHAIDSALAELKGFVDGRRPLTPFAAQAAAREALQEAMGYAEWQAFEARLARDAGGRP